MPWFQQNYKYKNTILQGGIPDFSAFKCPFMDYLYKLGIIKDNQGISINLLPVITNFRERTETIPEKKYNYDLIIGEAKTTSSSLPQAINQLKKYSNVELANKLFTIIPNSNKNDYFGSMYINNLYELNYKSGNQQTINYDNQIIDSNWLDLYLKILFLGNLPFEQIIILIDNFRNNHNLKKLEKYESIHLLDAIQNISNEEYYNYIRRIIWPTQAI